MTRLLAADPAKRASERFVLAYSLFWIGVIAAVTLSRAFARWGDPQHLALGAGLAAPLVLAPFLVERDRPLGERFATRFHLWVGLFALLQVYFGSALFFDVLGMEYHFRVRWVVNRTPLFLYPLTIAYFATYYVVMTVAWRAFTTRFPRAPSLARLAVRLVLGYGIAFAETGSMANPYLADCFFYRDKHFALLVGSLCYGTLFVLSFPFVFRLDEEREAPRPGMARLVGEVLAVNMLVLICYEGWAHLLGRAG